jgi:hypothetical protein
MIFHFDRTLSAASESGHLGIQSLLPFAIQWVCMGMDILFDRLLNLALG